MAIEYIPQTPKRLTFSILDELDGDYCHEEILVRLIHYWEAQNFKKEDILFGLELLLIDTEFTASWYMVSAEVITSTEFHPIHCNMFAYSSSKGFIRLIDMWKSTLCDSHTKLFEEPEAPGSRSFFTEIIASILDIKFSNDGRYILSRDYMTLKLWDINMDSGPLASYQVHEHLRPRLCDLYENDSIFDNFECCLSGDGLRVATGSYSNLFRVFGASPGSIEATILEASKNPMRRQIQTPARPSRSIGSMTHVVRRGS